MAKATFSSFSKVNMHPIFYFLWHVLLNSSASCVKLQVCRIFSNNFGSPETHVYTMFLIYSIVYILLLFKVVNFNGYFKHYGAKLRLGESTSRWQHWAIIVSCLSTMLTIKRLEPRIAPDVDFRECT